MQEFAREPERLTEVEAKELMQRLAASDQAKEEAAAQPSVGDVADLTGQDVSKVRRELDILRHENRLAELERQRQEEEALLRKMRAEREVEEESLEEVQARREAWLRRQEEMSEWASRNEPEVETAAARQRSSKALQVLVAVVFAILFLLFLISFMATTTVERSIETPVVPSTETERN
ncbi:MAG TPA: hypothetical protein VGE01_07735 [Fimbriimonas sp.]